VIATATRPFPIFERAHPLEAGNIFTLPILPCHPAAIIFQKPNNWYDQTHRRAVNALARLRLLYPAIGAAPARRDIA
jgi:hypothetical protein